MNYDPSSGQYELVPNLERVDVKKLTQARKKRFLKQQYKELFDQYVPDTDQVEKVQFKEDEYLVLQRKTRKPKQRRLDPGLYCFGNSTGDGVVLYEKTFPSQDVYVERDYTERLQDELYTFFSQRDVYERIGIQHRRGALLYGKPGTGKTHALLRSIRACMDDLSIVAFFLPSNFIGFSRLGEFAERFRHRNTVFIIEELVEHVRTTKAAVLSFLDGELSWDNNFTVSTTNHPGKLDSNLINRPGRFDRVMKFPMPDRDFRERFLREHLEQEISQELLERTEGFSVSYLKELVLRHDIYDQTIPEILDEFDDTRRLIRNSFRESDELVGF